MSDSDAPRPFAVVEHTTQSKVTVIPQGFIIQTANQPAERRTGASGEHEREH